MAVLEGGRQANPGGRDVRWNDASSMRWSVLLQLAALELLMLNRQVPQACRTTHTAGVSPFGRFDHDRRLVGEDVRRHKLR